MTQAVPAPRTGSRSAGRRRRKRASKYGWLIELPVVIVIALAVSLLLKTFLVQAFWIPSESMENTLLKGDRVLVEKLTTRVRDVQRGDVVVFHDPGDWLVDAGELPDSGARAGVRRAMEWVGLAPRRSSDDLIKRVIGVAGDRVVCCDKQDRVTVNGVALDEPYVYPGDQPSLQTFDVRVPEGHLWVMGDHRSNSQDSREHQSDSRGGMVPVDQVVGRAFVLVWPLDRFSRFPTPGTFEQPGLAVAPPMTPRSAMTGAGSA